jgi:sterol desaturase/sphingolipid hydroxylase (fatty acid hydroxylase superfamily)
MRYPGFGESIASTTVTPTSMFRPHFVIIRWKPLLQRFSSERSQLFWVSVHRALNRAIGWLVVTPAFHRMHHSVEQAETDSNFADVFAIWDRLCGTYRRPRDGVQCGLHEVAVHEAGSLTRQLQMPWLKIEPAPTKTSSRAPIE